MKRIVSTLVAVLMLLSATTAFASDINITIDGEDFVPKNALGEEVFPFIDNGSTFLPVRAMGEAVGKEVSFDSENNAVYIGTKPKAADVMRTPVALVGDRVFYEEDLTLYGDIQSMIFAQQIFTLAESKFTKEDIELKMSEVYAFMPPEELAILASNEYVLNEYIRVLACISLLEDNVTLDDSAYENYVTAKHILVWDKETADVVMSKLSDGADFAALVEEYNTDPGQTRDSAYTFTYGEMVEEFEKAAFALDENTYTKTPVETNYGYHIIYRLPLDKEAIDETQLKTAILEAEIANVQIDIAFEIMPQGDYGEVEGYVFTTDDLIFLGGSDASYAETFEFLESLVMVRTLFDNENVLTEEEKLEIEKLKAENKALYTELGDEGKAEFVANLATYYSVFFAKMMTGEISDELFAKGDLIEVDSRVYKEIRVFVDGKLIVPHDVNNNFVPPRNIDGTVYVPVRAIVESLGMTADWNNDTRTVVITK